jgi:hypothetical protein
MPKSGTSDRACRRLCVVLVYGCIFSRLAGRFQEKKIGHPWNSEEGVRRTAGGVRAVWDSVSVVCVSAGGCRKTCIPRLPQFDSSGDVIEVFWRRYLVRVGGGDRR